jgi:hypothetical protein
MLMATSCHEARGPPLERVNRTTWGWAAAMARHCKGQSISLNFNENTS